MARQFTKGLDLYKHQLKRFATMDRDAKRMHREIAQSGYSDHIELTSGGNGPQGPARKNWLRRMGHPFGRGINSAASTPGGLKRKGKASRSAVRNLPIGRISGELRMGWRMTREAGGTQSFGMKNSAPHVQYILSPHGTKKMVGRGFGGIQGQNGPRTGETVRRWRARNKAFVDTFRRKQRTI